MGLEFLLFVSWDLRPHRMGTAECQKDGSWGFALRNLLGRGQQPLDVASDPEHKRQVILNITLQFYAELGVLGQENRRGSYPLTFYPPRGTRVGG